MLPSERIGWNFLPKAAPEPSLILTDVDDTVLKYAEPFQDWCIARGMISENRGHDIPSVEILLNVDTARAVEIMLEFVADGGLTSQPAEPDALGVLPSLHRAGYRFVGVTACGTDLGVQRARKALLEATFGFTWEALHVVALGGAKTNVLNAYDSAIWVDDHHGHVMDGHELGHRSFLLNRPYNIRRPDPFIIDRVDNWYEIADALKVSLQ